MRGVRESVANLHSNAAGYTQGLGFNNTTTYFGLYAGVSIPLD